MQRGYTLVAIALLSLLSTACGSQGRPNRAIVVMTGRIDEVTDNQITSGVNRGLRDIGIDALIDWELLESDDPELVRAAMTRAEAAHAVVLEVASAKERPGVLTGSHLYAVSLTATIVNEDPEVPLIEPQTLEFAYEEKSAVEVEQRVLDTFITATVPYALDGLSLSPQITVLLGGEGETQDLISSAELKKNEEMVYLRHERAEGYKAYCAQELAGLANFADAEGIDCYGDPCGQYVLLGIDEKDRPVVQDVSRIPIYTVPPKRKGYWTEPPERIVAINPDRSEQVLVRSGNFYGVGSVRAGATTGNVETFSSEGSSAILGFSLDDGSHKQVTLLAKGERTSFSAVSPSNSGTFWCLKYDEGCFYESPLGRKQLDLMKWGRWVDIEAGPRIVG